MIQYIPNQGISVVRKNNIQPKSGQPENQPFSPEEEIVLKNLGFIKINNNKLYKKVSISNRIKMEIVVKHAIGLYFYKVSEVQIQGNKILEQDKYTCETFDDLIHKLHYIF